VSSAQVLRKNARRGATFLGGGRLSLWTLRPASGRALPTSRPAPARLTSNTRQSLQGGTLIAFWNTKPKSTPPSVDGRAHDTEETRGAGQALAFVLRVFGEHSCHIGAAAN